MRAASRQAAPSEVPQALTLSDALRLTLAYSPDLRAIAWELPKARGRVRQAQSRANPGLAFDLENFGGSLPGSAGREATLSLEQLVELGGKRSARIGAARADESLTARDIESRRLAISGETAARFMQLLALESVLELQTEEVSAAEEAATTTAQRVRSGAAPPVEERRAQVELANARLERVLIESQVSLAHTTLASLWGDPTARYTRLVGSLETEPRLAGLDTLLANLDSTPELARWREELGARRSRLALERALASPDLVIGAGLRSLRDPAETTYLGRVSIPLPLFDRNLGAIATATASLDQAEDERSGARLEATNAVVQAHGSVERSRRKLSALRLEVLPGARLAFDDIRIGFERGRFTYLELLEARRTWIRARRENLAALLELQLGIIELRRLTASSATEFLDTIGGQPR